MQLRLEGFFTLLGLSIAMASGCAAQGAGPGWTDDKEFGVVEELLSKPQAFVDEAGQLHIEVDWNPASDYGAPYQDEIITVQVLQPKSEDIRATLTYQLADGDGTAVESFRGPAMDISTLPGEWTELTIRLTGNVSVLEANGHDSMYEVDHNWKWRATATRIHEVAAEALYTIPTRTSCVETPCSEGYCVDGVCVVRDTYY